MIIERHDRDCRVMTRPATIGRRTIMCSFGLAAVEQLVRKDVQYHGGYDHDDVLGIHPGDAGDLRSGGSIDSARFALMVSRAPRSSGRGDGKHFRAGAFYPGTG